MKNLRKGEWIIIILLFAFSLGIGNFEKYCVAAITIIFIYQKMKKRDFKVSLKSQTIPLFLWGMTYYAMCVFNGENPIVAAVYYVLAPIFLCGLGYYLIKDDSYESVFIRYSFVVAFGFFLHALLSIGYSITHNIFQFNAEYVYDFWTGRMISRTIMGMYMVPIVCLCIPRFFSTDKKEKTKILKVLDLLLILVPVGLSIYVGNRSLLVITIALILCTVIVGLSESKNKLKFISIVVFIVLIVLILYLNNFAGIQEYISSSFLAKRSADLRADGRFYVYREIFRNFDNYIVGWMTSGGFIEGSSLKWAHNIWLDIYIYSGLIPFIFFGWYTIRIVKDSIRTVKNRYLLLSTRLFAATFLIGTLLNWAVEPVLQSNPYFVSACCFIFGMNAGLKKH